MSTLTQWKAKALALKCEVHAVYLALHDARTPWYAKLVAFCVVAYAVSPIDLIPDPIPVLGYLDDLILIPLGVALLQRLIPPQVMADCRARAAKGSPHAGLLAAVGALTIAAIWLAGLVAGAYVVWRQFTR